jgi:hypothetical protein
MDIGILQISDPESAHMFVLIPVYDVKTKKLQIFYILDKTWAADLYLNDIQTRAEGESLYIRYRSDANVLAYLKNDPSYEFIGEVNLKINIV